MKRRDFVKISAACGLGFSVFPVISNSVFALDDTKPKTNIDFALKLPRTENSLPGKYPGRVIHINDKNAVREDKINEDVVYKMVASGMLALTGEKDLKAAYKHFFSDQDRIGLKVNPVAGPTLSTSLEITRVIIQQLNEAGISGEKLLIWDRREFEMHECGFTQDNFPGIKIIGTEQKDASGSFYDKDGNLYGDKMIDRDWFYWADTEEKYDAETIPYMVNEGKYSYFSRIVTEMVDKIINIPILKNAGSSVTLCLKNLAYGAVSNTGRLHKQLWSETSAEVPAFPPLRDKVVLNIVDGIKGCFDGGPGANPQFFFNFNTVLIGTDPVAVDRIGYDIVIKKRIEEKVQQSDNARGRNFMELASKNGLGISDINKIDLTTINL